MLHLCYLFDEDSKNEKNNCYGQFKYFMLHMCSILDGKIIVGNLNSVLHMCYVLDECSKARCT
jgi:hypothetical protein